MLTYFLTTFPGFYINKIKIYFAKQRGTEPQLNPAPPPLPPTSAWRQYRRSAAQLASPRSPKRPRTRRRIQFPQPRVQLLTKRVRFLQKSVRHLWARRGRRVSCLCRATFAAARQRPTRRRDGAARRTDACRCFLPLLFTRELTP